MDLIDIAFLAELSKLGFGSFEQTKRKVIERTIKPSKEIKKGRVNPRSIYSSKQNPIRDITIDEPGGWMEGLKEEARKKRSGPAGKGLKWMEVEGKTSEGSFLKAAASDEDQFAKLKAKGVNPDAIKMLRQAGKAKNVDEAEDIMNKMHAAGHFGTDPKIWAKVRAGMAKSRAMERAAMHA